jgi:WD40 repeat protein
VTGSADRTAIVWDAATGQKLQTFRERDRIKSVATTANGNLVVTGCENTASLWDVETGERRHAFDGSADHRALTDITPDGNAVVTGGRDVVDVTLWKADDAEALQQFRHGEAVLSVAISRNGQRVLVGSTGAVLWDAKSGEKIRTFPSAGGSWSVALSDDGGRAVVGGGSDSSVTIFDIETGEAVQTFRGHSNLVTSVALSPDGEHLWTGSRDGTARLWDVATGLELCRLQGFANGREWLVVSPDGHFDGSPGGIAQLTWRDKASHQAVSNDEDIRQSFHRSGLLATISTDE